MNTMQNTLFGKKVIKSVGTNEAEIIKDILYLHNNGEPIELDATYSVGNFYKTIPKPKYKFDINPQIEGVKKANANNLPFENNVITSIMFDPPFVFGNRESNRRNIMAKRFSIFRGFEELEAMYYSSLKEFHRILKPSGLLIFKCQDYTDAKTVFTHNFVYNWATEIGFYAKDLFILIAKNRIFNSNLKQRHARKFHSYFWVFKK